MSLVLLVLVTSVEVRLLKHHQIMMEHMRYMGGVLADIFVKKEHLSLYHVLQEHMGI